VAELSAGGFDEHTRRSVLPLPMFADARRLGALNALAEHADAFDDTSRNVGTVYAALGALAWGSVVLHRQMAAAVQSRAIIGQAKGMLMERYKIDAQQAFNMLGNLSQNSNVPLPTFASQLVAASGSAVTDD
jgi:hypothetical protein